MCESPRHAHDVRAPEAAGCMVVTVSDTRTKETDKSGQTISQLLQAHGWEVSDYRIVTDDAAAIRAAIAEAVDRDDIRVVVTSGGTGIAMRDVTYETVQALLDKPMPGFGELFRYISYAEEIGPAAMLSRATAGVIRRTAIFALPGSTGAVKLAMTRLILPELGHILREIDKDTR